jgi:2-polyprenyl-6-methoxyphenol hydroxylase-like FAD-dependent oxidoreductase
MPLALIVGAGIGGVAAGLALRHAGWDIRIFERTAAPRELGFGLALMPNAIRALRDLGVADKVLSHAGRPISAEFRAEIRRSDGRVLRRFAGRLDQLPDADLATVVLRPVLHTALLDAAVRKRSLLDSRAVGLDIGGSGVVLRLANGATAPGNILIGADGVASVIRSQLHPHEPPPRPSGYAALRGMSPLHVLGGLQFLGYIGPGVESGIVQASATLAYWYLSFLADELDTNALDAQTVLRRFAPRFDAHFRGITAAAVDMRVDELFVRTPLAQWGAGPVTLLGDAAHPMLPHTGQGAAQALEDAVALGRAVAASSDPRVALRQYERARTRRTRRVVNMGPRIARMTTTRNPVVTVLRNTAIRIVPQRIFLSGFVRPRRTGRFGPLKTPRSPNSNT